MAITRSPFATSPRKRASLSVLYHYYASKQELLYGVLNEAIDSFHAILARHSTDEHATPVNKTLALVASMVEYRAALRIESLLFIREMRNLEPDYVGQSRIGVRTSRAYSRRDCRGNTGRGDRYAVSR